MFPTTQPTDPGDAPRRSRRTPSAFEAALPLADVLDSRVTDISSLSPSLMMDLQRFERAGEQRELLEVLAACKRHTQAVAVRLAWGWHELTLTVFPLDSLVHCPMRLTEFVAGDLSAVRVLQVQPAALRPPGDAEMVRVGNPAFYSPLSPLLWSVALNGARRDLLPELAGLAAYRVGPGLNLAELPLTPVQSLCIERLRQRTCNLREIAEWHRLGREQASRLLNALYLQSGLIVTRTHPAATNESWGGYR